MGSLPGARHNVISLQVKHLNMKNKSEFSNGRGWHGPVCPSSNNSIIKAKKASGARVKDEWSERPLAYTSANKTPRQEYPNLAD